MKRLLLTLACTQVCLSAGLDEATASCTSSFAAGVLAVIGDSAANQVVVEQNDGANLIDVTCDSATSTYGSFQVKQINVALKGGDDELFYGLAPGTDLLFEKHANISLGGGNDDAWLEFRDGIGGGVILKGGPNVVLEAGAGDDELIAHFGWVHGGTMSLVAKMGGGADYSFTNMWGDVTGSADVLFDVRGGAGPDELSTWNTFDNQEYSYGSIDISDDSSFAIKLDGGDGIDNIGALYSGAIDGKLNVVAKGGLGSDVDTIMTDVYADAESDGTLDALTKGLGGNDWLSLKVYDSSGGQLAIPQALIDGGDGYDHCKKTANVSKINCEAFWFNFVLIPLEP